MGRMLETMKLSHGRHAPLAITKPVEEPPVKDCVVDWEIAEEVPYVEVGGPDKKLDLSPGLMKHAPQAAPQPPHLPVENAPVAPKPVTLTEPLPSVVAYEAWPADAVARVEISSEIVAYHQPDHATSQEYAALLQALRNSLKADVGNVLLLSGLKPGVGTSTVLLNLATIAAMQHKLRVVVVDANGPRAALAQKLGHGAAAGLQEVIDGTLALEHAIVKTPILSLHLLPAGNSSKKLTSGAMTWLAAWLRERYDLIFVDGPTMDETAAVAVHIPYADANYLVLPHGENAVAGQEAAKSMARMGGRLCGLIHTHFGD